MRKKKKKRGRPNLFCCDANRCDAKTGALDASGDRRDLDASGDLDAIDLEIAEIEMHLEIAEIEMRSGDRRDLDARSKCDLSMRLSCEAKTGALIFRNSTSR